MKRRDAIATFTRWAACSALADLPAGVLANPTVALGVSERPLQFPADFGAHPDTRIEWWYLTGTLQADRQQYGFQVTFFRSRTDLPEAQGSRFAARQLIFAHAAVTDLAQKRLRHDQRIARAGFGIAGAEEGDTHVTLRDWSLKREGAATQSTYRTQASSQSAGFSMALQFTTSQPLLLQGRSGLSQKGPRPAQASHYYSQPQLAVNGTLALDGQSRAVTGRAWLDHEWSDSLLDPAAVGWDWIGMNFDDGSALTAFRLRRADGSALWAGGSFRRPGDAAAQSFAAQAVRFTPLRTWRSTVSQATYPVEWTVETPAGRFRVQALLDDQELDSRGSTGAIYWEGLSELTDPAGRRVGSGYLEMTGYAQPLAL